MKKSLQLMALAMLLASTAHRSGAQMLMKSVGEQSGSYFGVTVSAGDLNGDGYPDVVVGAPYYYEGASYQLYGAVYVFWGGPQMDSLYDLKIVGQQLYAGFGISVSASGDLNGDGFDDLVVGAPYYDYNQMGDIGAIFIFWGGSEIDTLRPLLMIGEGRNNWFGSSVAILSDMNGDGFDELGVGADRYSSGQDTTIGAGYIFFGGSPFDTSRQVKISGEQPGDRLATSVGSAGDVNGDGYNDAIFGAFYADNDSIIDAGAAYVLFGGSTMDSVPDLILRGEEENERFGFTVSGGDFNNDGYSDAVVGAYAHNVGASCCNGGVYIYYGSTQPDRFPDLMLIGENEFDEFGYSVSAGDVNGDGIVDLIVDAYGFLSNRGAAYVFTGSSDPDTIYDSRVMGERSSDNWMSTAYAGDVNGDGYGDYVVGGVGYDAGGTSDVGVIYVFAGSPIAIHEDPVTPPKVRNGTLVVNDMIALPADPGRVLVISADGRIIREFSKPHGTMKLPAGDLKPGLYFIRVGGKTMKFIKMPE